MEDLGIDLSLCMSVTSPFILGPRFYSTIIVQSIKLALHKFYDKLKLMLPFPSKLKSVNDLLKIEG